MTTPEQWPRVKEILGAALACEVSERSGFLDVACSNDDQLRSEVESLIAAYEKAGDLSSPVFYNLSSQEATANQTIGPYQLKRLLGSGGMGQVWLAEQTDPVHRHVALKLIRNDLYDRETTYRFLAERQSLALMNHPSIARIFDAGTTMSGQPYLVMEYVDGSPITEYCDHKQLSIEERLRLFQRVCEGVQHAHQKAIIHRDLKPSNILVAEIDGKPIPRIIDFGIAKALTETSSKQTFLTRAGAIVGTIGYISPEQADGAISDIDTRSDVYSLGVILYELLAGELPFDPRGFTYYETLRKLKEQDAPRPSVKVRESTESSSIAHNRKMNSGALCSLLRGDCDAIALKAIEKDRDRRYPMPSTLSADIDHFLRKEPVSAQTINFSYVSRKYISRHRAGISIALIATIAVIAFIFVQTVQLRRVRRERDRADRITEFMTDMFKVSDPSESRGNSITAREILDRSSHQIQTGLSLDWQAQSQLLQVMAKTYMGLGLYKEAHALTEETVATRARSLGPDDPKTLESATQLAEILEREGHVAEAEASMKQIIDRESRVLGPEDPLTLKTRSDLAGIFLSHAHYIETEGIERSIIPIEMRRLGSADPTVFRSQNNLASALKGQSRFDEAESLFHQILNDERHTFGTDHPYVLVTMHNLATMLANQGRQSEAEALYRETLAIQKRVLGPDHPETADTQTTLANTVVYDSNRRAEAESLYRESIATELRVVNADHVYVTRAKEGLANALNSEASAMSGPPSSPERHQKYAEAQCLLEEVLASRQRTIGPNDTDTLLTGYNLADIFYREGKYADSERRMRDTLADQQHVLDPNDPDIFASKTLLAKVLLREGESGEAQSLAREAFDAQLRVLGPGHDDTQDSLQVLTEALAKLGRFSEAQALWKTTIDQIASSKPGKSSDAWVNFAESAAAAGHKQEAVECLERAAQAGFNDVAYLKNDAKFDSIRGNPRYQRIITAAQMQSQKTP